MSKRRTYTAEFKAAAVSRLLEAGEKPSVVSRELGVTLTQLKTWRLEQQAAGSAEALAAQKADAAELQRLRRENKRLAEENEILQKASVFFAKRAEKA
jgi:transposase